MYCTGGIRCDVCSTFLRQQGFEILYTLEGCVQNYLESEGAAGWNGSLFMFDDQMTTSEEQL
jgi:predicted sulfurtransferase